MSEGAKAVSNEQIWEVLTLMRDELRENTRAIRGYNGDMGLVGRVYAVECNYQRLLTNELPHLEERIDVKIGHLREERENALTEEKKDALHWRPILAQFVLPILMSIITALIVSGVIDRIPHGP